MYNNLLVLTYELVKYHVYYGVWGVRHLRGNYNLLGCVALIIVFGIKRRFKRALFHNFPRPKQMSWRLFREATSIAFWNHAIFNNGVEMTMPQSEEK